MGAVAAVVGASVVGGLFASSSARRSANQQRDASQSAIAESRRQFDLIFKETEAARGASKAAFGQLQNFLGLGEEGFDATAALEETPGFQFRFDQGQQAVENAQSTPGGGSRFGGRALKELTRFGQGFGANEFQNEFSRLLDVARTGGAVGTGVAATAGTASARQQGVFGLANAGAGPAGQNQAFQGTLQNLFTLAPLLRQQQQTGNQAQTFSFTNEPNPTFTNPSF